MDNIDIRQCVNQDNSELKKIYCGIVARDDFHIINKNLESFRKFLITSLLENNVENFPLAFMMNTGTHKNGGVHWQGIYFDHKHRVFFFDSYGRKPMNQFKVFAKLILIYSFIRQRYRQYTLSQVLSKDLFTSSLFNQMLQRQLRSVSDNTYNYYNRQLQSDFTNVCGEYSLMFLYSVCRQVHPEYHAYDYFNQNPTVFTPINKSTEEEASRNKYHHRINYILMTNDKHIRNIVENKFGFFTKSILS